MKHDNRGEQLLNDTYVSPILRAAFADPQNLKSEKKKEEKKKKEQFLTGFLQYKQQ